MKGAESGRGVGELLAAVAANVAAVPVALGFVVLGGAVLIGRGVRDLAGQALGLRRARGIRGGPHAERRPPDAAVSACLDFYRKELTAQHEAVAFRWWRSLPDFLLFFFIIRMAFVGVFLYEPLRIILPGLFGLILFARFRKGRKLRRELDALDTFEAVPDASHTG